MNRTQRIINLRKAAIANRRKVSMYDCSTGETTNFESITEAAVFLNVRTQRISEQLCGKVKTLKRKYKFSYINN